MKIVEIKPRRKSVCGILFDCEVDPKEYGADCDAAGLLSLDSELCEIKHLKPGMEIDEQELSDIVKQSHIKRAKSRAMWYLSQSSCAKKMLVTKLKRSFPEFAAVIAVERMEELGLIDDEVYAKHRLRRIVEEKKVSVKYAKQLLRAEGIDAEQIDAAEQELYDTDYSPKSVIADIIERKYKSKLNDKNNVQKVIAALMRKGYSYSEIREVLSDFECETEYIE